MADKIYKTINDLPNIQEKATFFGVPYNSEEADDVLFAVQAYYGKPKLDYPDVVANYSDDEVKAAVDYVKKKGYNKFTYFSDDPYGDGGY